MLEDIAAQFLQNTTDTQVDLLSIALFRTLFWKTQLEAICAKAKTTVG
jgi:hypothetical protein